MPHRFDGMGYRHSDLADSAAPCLRLSANSSPVTNPGKSPIDYNEARDFYSNVSRLSADEAQKLTPVMKRAIGQFAGDLRDTISATAEGVGKGDQLEGAMQLYGRAKSWQQFGTDLWSGMKRGLPWAIGSGAGAVGGYYAVKKLSDLLTP